MFGENLRIAYLFCLLFTVSLSAQSHDAQVRSSKPDDIVNAGSNAVYEVGVLVNSLVNTIGLPLNLDETFKQLLQTLLAGNGVVNQFNNLVKQTLLGKILYGENDGSTCVRFVPNDIKTEKHFVYTDDGYELIMFRLFKPESEHKKEKRVVFLQHGLLCSSCMWISGTTPETSLAILLVSLGFDVWLGNYRGNHISTGHKNYTLEDAEYWQFSFHEMGIYDLPAMIGHVIKTTNVEKIDYIGHSMGTTGFFIWMSQRPEDNKYIRRMIALAPEAFMHGLETPLIFFSEISRLFDLDRIIAQTNVQLIEGRALPILILNQCSQEIFSRVCQVMNIFLFGGGLKHVDQEVFKRFAKYFPSGASLRTMLHYAQLFSDSNRQNKPDLFRAWDYGSRLLNERKYQGASEPPHYKLDNIRIEKMHMFYGKDDKLANVEDVERLKKYIVNTPTTFTLIERNTFGHVDFVYGDDINEVNQQAAHWLL